MATTPATIDSLSKDERALVVASLELKKASVLRAAKAASNPAIQEILSREASAIDVLVIRFR